MAHGEKVPPGDMEIVEPWSVGNDDKMPTLKLRRPKIMEVFRNEIDSFSSAIESGGLSEPMP